MDKKKLSSPTSRFLSIGLIALFSLAGVAAEVPKGVHLSSVQELVRNNGAEPATLDPHKTTGVPEGTIIGDLLEGLASFSPTGKVEPGVAHSWTHSQDLKIWTFYLRPEAKWSNGDPLTAHDFVYSWRRIADPRTASPDISYIQSLRLLNVDEIGRGERAAETLGIEALDDHTLQLSLASPLPYLDKMMANSTMFPVHRATVEKFADRWTLPENWVGNGAYRLDKWLVNEKIVLRRNSNYWNDAKTVIDQVTFLPIEKEGNDVKRYQAGEVDLTYRGLPADQFKKLKREIPQEVRVSRVVALYFYALNNTKPPLNDPRVRRALSLALQREEISKLLGQGQQPAYSFNPSYMDGFKPQLANWANWSDADRLAEAKKLLREAGYGQKNPLKLTITYNTSEQHKLVALAAGAMWKKAFGAVVSLENQENKSFMENCRLGKMEVARGIWFADYNEPSANLNIFRSNSNCSYTGYSSSRFDELMSRALLAANQAERNEFYQQAEIQLMDDMPVIPIFHDVTVRLVKPYVGGYRDDNPMDRVRAKDLYIIKH